MGCTASTQALEDENDPFLQNQKVNDVIEQSLQMEKQRDKNEIKLLLLGAGESGKSTVLKQLKLLHKGGFSNQERLQYSQVIWADAIQSMKILIIQARKLGISLDCDEPGELFELKRILMKTKALDFINASVAGGSEFLNDYVLKYSERYENKRRVQSTGKAKAFDEKELKPEEDGSNNNGDQNNKLNFQEISKNLNETGDEKMFVKNEIRKPSERKVTNEQIANAISELWKKDKGIKQCLSLIHI